MTDEEFRGYFPGSKQELPPGPPTPKRRQVNTGWDEGHRTVRKSVKGREVELFSIGAVCSALGRPHVTVRHWIREGHIPPAPFKMPPRNGIEGRRLYSREHIEALVDLAQKNGLLEEPRIDWTEHADFAAQVRAAWQNIAL